MHREMAGFCMKLFLVVSFIPRATTRPSKAPKALTFRFNLNRWVGIDNMEESIHPFFKHPFCCVFSMYASYFQQIIYIGAYHVANIQESIELFLKFCDDLMIERYFWLKGFSKNSKTGWWMDTLEIVVWDHTSTKGRHEFCDFSLAYDPFRQLSTSRMMEISVSDTVR